MMKFSVTSAVQDVVASSSKYLTNPGEHHGMIGEFVRRGGLRALSHTRGRGLLLAGTSTTLYSVRNGRDCIARHSM